MSLKFFILLFGINFISLRTCYFIQFFPVTCITLAVQIQFYIGVDRLLSIAFPIWYNFDDRYKSVVVIVILIMIRSARTCWNFLNMAISFPDRYVTSYSTNFLENFQIPSLITLEHNPH
ncbi:unnamed protein product [Meloidogyne enterolobii]|uniref:Uncharacterized protein n=1 Tax=Meloidogyne enterolobii TaxID=390850 RepID=A0ACB0ZMW5_MELEN